MKSILIFFNIMILGTNCASANMFKFKSNISKNVLENYLSRSIEYAGLCGDGSHGAAPYFDDCLRMISNIKPKFIGRAAFAWDAPIDDDEHYRIAKENADRIHKIDLEIILQACVFEAVYSCKVAEAKKRKISPGGVENISIPAWVFKEFGIEPEKRCFSYKKMIFKDGKFLNLWGPGASVPDITRLETRLWFYYRARRYIDAGYESIHFGQILLVGADDSSAKYWKELLKRLRKYAGKRARRNYVLFDGHIVVNSNTMNFVKSGENLLWDFLSFPLRPLENTHPLNAKLELGYLDSIYGRAPGGIHPSGWQCEFIPQIIEVDNYQSGLALDNEVLIWGADETTWFANLKEEKRNEFLHYASKWIWDNAPGAYLEMPGRRPALVPVAKPRMWSYIANTRSKDCPEGFNQEETIKAIWNNCQFNNNSKRKFKKRLFDTSKRKYKSNGLIGHWSFEKMSSNILEDVSGSGNNAYLQNDYSLEELYALYRVHGDFNSAEERKRGKKVLAEKVIIPFSSFLTNGLKNKAFKFDGTTYIKTISFADKGSFVIWVKFNKLNESFVLFQNFIWDVSGMYIKYYHPEKNLYVEIFDGSGKRRTNSFGNVSTGKWTQLAYTVDGKKLKTYVNGNLVNSVGAGLIIPNRAPVIGRYCKNILVEDIMFFDISLTDTEIKKLYDSYLK